MNITDKAQRLFEYISQVYSIDLPVYRDLREYRGELWWQADLPQNASCKIKEVDKLFAENSIGESESVSGDDCWLSVTKKTIDLPPALPLSLKDWVVLTDNPTKRPSPKTSIIYRLRLDDDPERVNTYEEYREAWDRHRKLGGDTEPLVPEIIEDWLDLEEDESGLHPVKIEVREITKKFEDDAARKTAFENYLSTQWKPWSDRVSPQYYANSLYDEFYALHQRLSIEGDRLELVWGHVLLSWNVSAGNQVYHPLFLTPMNLEFDSARRNISMKPSLTSTTKFDLDCLSNIDYPMKDELVRHSFKINSREFPADIWNNNQMMGLSASITGCLSSEPAGKTNLYNDNPESRPPLSHLPIIYNSPVIFTRERARRLWIDDARNVSESIEREQKVPSFIESLVADPKSGEKYAVDDRQTFTHVDYDNGELLLPLEYNDQQKEILDKLNKSFGVLVQGPPGTGKSHTIANIVSSLLARGKRVLVTSQTENALKVLRGYIPEEIRSLCVSQIGNDTEAKRQLNEAVDAIGRQVANRDHVSSEKEVKIILDELRSVHERQSRILNQIREWVELGSCSIVIDGQAVNSQLAARECSEKEGIYSWFPDRISPEAESPLSNDELLELCFRLQTTTRTDRASFQKHLPALDVILSPSDFDVLCSELNSSEIVVNETIEVRNEWEPKISSATLANIQDAIMFLETMSADLENISEPWQQRVLELSTSEESQHAFWHDILKTLKVHRDSAWEAYKKIQGYEIVVGEIKQGIDVDVLIAELFTIISKGKNPSKFTTRLWLSNEAKTLFDSMSVDGHKVINIDRLNLVRSFFAYRSRLKKIGLMWHQIITAVNGPSLNLNSAMPLAEVDSRLASLKEVLDWELKYVEECRSKLSSLGCDGRVFYKLDIMQRYAKALYGQTASHRFDEINERLNAYNDFIDKNATREDAHTLWSELSKATASLSIDLYEMTYSEIDRLQRSRNDVSRLEDLLSRLRSVSPLWAGTLEVEAVMRGKDVLPADWELAWRWSRLNEWLIKLHERESVEALQNKLERLRRNERELITRLVCKRTWQRQLANVQDHHYRALTSWASEMRLYGKGTGKHAPRHLDNARKYMVEAVGAVPAWIMPLHKVVQSFKAEPELFDVVIVDEASQCDIRSLTVLFRAKKVLIVGDPEQISPENVGVQQDKVYEVMHRLLSDIPYYETFDIKKSLYEIAKAIPRMDKTLLTEHFRCVPQIIEFNNSLCPSYNGQLEPLRQPNPNERLDPPIVTVFIENGYKDNNDINRPEAEAIVEQIVKCCKDDRYNGKGGNYRKRTIGIISLLGDKQAKHISDLIATHEGIDETEIEERRITCGDAYAFQGDERDVMFLSMVVAPNAAFAAQVTDAARQRFNVATSRARDQVFLFHSVQLDRIKNSECVRHKLLSWYQNPQFAEVTADLETLKNKIDSEFEYEVGEKLIKKGYTVIPQFKPLPHDFNYRIDLVVQGEKNRLAVECDGDRYHGPERWEYDQRREAQLRRAGWKFWRISGSAYYRNKEKALDGLWKYLDEEGIKPRRQDIAEKAQEKAQVVSRQTTIPEDLQPVITSEVRKSPAKTSGPFKPRQESLLPILEFPITSSVAGEDVNADVKLVKVGDNVIVLDENLNTECVYTIGGPDSPQRVSPVSPVGRALTGSKKGDIVEIEAPGKTRVLRVLNII